MAIKFFYEAKNWSINWMCKQLEISRAAYYKWLHREIPKQEAENMKLAELIKEYDERFNHILGYRRMTSWINHFNHSDYKPKRVHRIMKKLGIHSVIRKKKKKYASSTPETIAENKLGRDFYADAPNKKWATDVTEFNLRGEKAYLSPILDGYNQEVISYNISKSPNLEQINDMLNKAFNKNNNLDGLIFHSDQGWQYQHEHYINSLKEHGIIQSMSRKGNCYDNCIMETFFGRLKNEIYYGYESEYKSFEEFSNAMKEYIDYYNSERIQAKTKWMPPVQYRLASMC